MHTKTDAELLLDYRATSGEEAFGEIVGRYADFVYSAALRQSGGPEVARDLAQVVFTQLARKAAFLDANTILAGWLCRATRLAALEQLRRDRRRLHRERQAMESQELANDPGSDWTGIRGLLDEGIATLKEDDRNALLLRFFRNESLTNVGIKLGVTEDAAQKRVSRALGRLREFLAARGINTTAEALSVAIATNAVQAAPAGFSTALTSYALAAGAQAHFFSSLVKVVTVSHMKTAIVILGCTGAIVALGYQYLDKERPLREARAAAAAQLSQVEALSATNDALSRQINELRGVRDQERELLRLRAEVTRLRRDQAALKKATAEATPLNSNTSPQTGEPQILIVSKFISLPTRKLSEAGSLTVPRGGVQLMSDDEMEAAMEALKVVDGMEVVAQPRMQTVNGVEASLSSANVDGTNANIGASLSANPHYSTNSPYITLDVRAQLGEVPGGPGQEDQPWNALAGITNSVTVIDGQTIVLREDMDGASRGIAAGKAATGPQTLVVFLTPHLIDAAGSYNRLKAVVKRKN